MKYIERAITPAIERAAKYFPVIVVTGPRQSGKSTLCRHIFDTFERYNLEDVALRERVRQDPKLFIAHCGDKTVIDEVQHVPDLFSYIQVEVDENPERRFVLTGSSNFSLMEKITQSLAGRAALFTLLPFSFAEIGSLVDRPTDELMFKGFYPSVITDTRPTDLFYPAYYSTYIERDVRQIKNISDISAFQTFMRLAAGRCGSEFNASQLATEIGVTSPTIKKWLSVLQTSYVSFLLPPYFANLGKRLTKTPKIYFFDTGLLCFLLGIESPQQLSVHPLRGSIFENMAVTELLKQRYNIGKQSNLYFYRENSGREADIVTLAGDMLEIYEIKSSATYNSAFEKNLKYLCGLLSPKVSSTKVVYDGNPIPPSVINIRQI